MELHFKYFDKVRAVDERLERDGEDEDEDEMYLKRLEGGLFTLQLVDYIMLEICASGAPSIKQRVQHILNLRSASVKTIRDIMRGKLCHFTFSTSLSSQLESYRVFCAEYAGNLGEMGSESETKEEEKQHILQLLDKF